MLIREARGTKRMRRRWS